MVPMTHSRNNRLRKSPITRFLPFRFAAALSICAALIATAAAQVSTHATADLLSQLIQIDSSNPPGSENKIAEFLAARFRPLGFDIHIVPTPEAGKAHFIARLRGDGSRRPVLLAAH